MFPIPSWSISGVIQDIRELKTKEGKVWAYMCKLMAMGGTYELQTRDPNITHGVAAGQMADAVGTFEQYNGELRLTLSRIVPTKAANPAK